MLAAGQGAHSCGAIQPLHLGGREAPLRCMDEWLGCAWAAVKGAGAEWKDAGVCSGFDVYRWVGVRAGWLDSSRDIRPDDFRSRVPLSDTRQGRPQCPQHLARGCRAFCLHDVDRRAAADRAQLSVYTQSRLGSGLSKPAFHVHMRSPCLHAEKACHVGCRRLEYQWGDCDCSHPCLCSSFAWRVLWQRAPCWDAHVQCSSCESMLGVQRDKGLA